MLSKLLGRRRDDWKDDLRIELTDVLDGYVNQQLDKSDCGRSQLSTMADVVDVVERVHIATTLSFIIPWLQANRDNNSELTPDKLKEERESIRRFTRAVFDDFNLNLAHALESAAKKYNVTNPLNDKDDVNTQTREYALQLIREKEESQ